MKLPDVGTLFEGRYELAAELGRGGFAAVYRAIDRSVQREVAIKVLLPSDDAQSEANSARFLREARMLSQFQHPNIVTLFDSGQSNGLLYMVFEYVAGRDLATVLKEDGPIDPASVVHMLDQLLDALHVAHTQGLLHRDVKPANVLVHTYYDDPYRVKLLDFGIAKLVDGNETRQLTKTGMVVGTIRYMAPEQLFGEPLDARTDLYALGLVGTEMLTGKPVIDGPSQRDLMAAQAASTPLVVPADAAPPTLRTVLERAMARAPEHRWPAAAAMRNALFAERSGPISRPLALAPGFGSGPQPGVPRSGPHHAVHRTGPQASVARPYSGPHQAPPKARSPFLTWGPLIVGIAFGVGLVLFALSDSSESNNRIAAAPAPRLVVQPTNTEPTSAQGHEPTQASADTPDQNEATVDGTGGCGKPSPGSYDSRLDLDWPGGPVDAYIPDGYDGTRSAADRDALPPQVSQREIFPEHFPVQAACRQAPFRRARPGYEDADGLEQYRDERHSRRVIRRARAVVYRSEATVLRGRRDGRKARAQDCLPDTDFGLRDHDGCHGTDVQTADQDGAASHLGKERQDLATRRRPELQPD